MDGNKETLKCLVNWVGLEHASRLVGRRPAVLLGHMQQDYEELNSRLSRLREMKNHLAYNEEFVINGTNSIGFNGVNELRASYDESFVIVFDRIGLKNAMDRFGKMPGVVSLGYILRCEEKTTLLMSSVKDTIENNIEGTKCEENLLVDESELLVELVKERLGHKDRSMLPFEEVEMTENVNRCVSYLLDDEDLVEEQVAILDQV